MQPDVDPETIVYFGGKFVPMREASVGILTHALHYGTGVFEGIRAHWDESSQELFIMRPREHYERWKRNCGILRIDVPNAVEELCAITVELLQRNNFRANLYIRPLAYKCAQRIGVATDDRDAFAIAAIPFGEYFAAQNGLHAGVSAWRRNEDNAIPPRAKICGAYANSALASDDAHRCGFDEAILLNQSGHVTEGATCNLFMVRGGRLVTPSITEDVLEGITRDTVMELTRREMEVETIERPIDRSELYYCDELFLAGTGVAIVPVVKVDYRPVKDGAVGPLTTRLRQLYFDATHGHLPAYRKWLLPVYGVGGPLEKTAARVKETSLA
ncbi:MAG: branched-chain amino acid transaminase [Terracidiphilus sp.]